MEPLACVIVMASGTYKLVMLSYYKSSVYIGVVHV